MNGKRAKDIRSLARLVVANDPRYSDRDYKRLYKKLKRVQSRGY